MKKILLVAVLFVASMTVFVGCSKDDGDKVDNSRVGCWELKMTASGQSDTELFWGSGVEADQYLKTMKAVAQLFGVTLKTSKKVSDEIEENCVSDDDWDWD